MSSVPLTNTHLHTNYSFSVFESPAEAVERAVAEGVRILGINDHYTVAGHEEFKRACLARRVTPMFSMEAVALDTEALAKGYRYNDVNPGRVYLTAKAITRQLPEDGFGAAALRRMRRALTERNRQLVENLNRHLGAIGEPLRITMEAVEALTPAGNTTERHVIQALAEAILSQGPERAGEIAKQLCGSPAPDLQRGGALQDYLRNKLVKAGGPDYAPELPEAYVTIPEMVAMFLEMGSIPTYPVLGNPVTEIEGHIPDLIKYLETFRIYALEVIPNRNTRERLLEIVQAAQEASVPIFTGTEHNTKTPMPLVDKFSADEPFRTAFFQGALVALGHQEAVAQGEVGYVRADGSLRFEDRQQGLAYFRELGNKVFRQFNPNY